MFLRTIYCTFTLLLCIICGFLVAKPVSYLIAQAESDNSAEDQKLVAATENIVIVPNGSSKKPRHQILEEAVERELKSSGVPQQKPTLRIIPATRSRVPRGKTMMPRKSSQKVMRSIPQVAKFNFRKMPQAKNTAVRPTFRSTIPAAEELVVDLPRGRKNGDDFTQGMQRPSKSNLFGNLTAGAVVPAELAIGKAETSKAIPVAFLESNKEGDTGTQKKSDSSKKAPFTLLKRAVNGLNRRSEPKAPRRFVPTNPKPVTQDGSESRQPVRPSSQGTIIQTQQNGEISRELEKLYRKDGRQMPSFRSGAATQAPANGGQNVAPGQNSGNQLRQPPERSDNRPLWKRFLRIGRKPQQQQKPPYQQPQNQQPDSQGAAQNYGNRNQPGVPNSQAPQAFPLNGQNNPRIGRNPGAFPGTASEGGFNVESFQPLNQESRRINGDAPQFDAFSNDFDPFATPQNISSSQGLGGGGSANSGTQKYSDPLSEEFNPFASPDPEQTQGPSLGSPSGNIESDPTSDAFNPFAGAERRSRQQETQTATPSAGVRGDQDQVPVKNPFKKDFNPFENSENVDNGVQAPEDFSKGSEDPNSDAFNPFGQMDDAPMGDESLDDLGEMEITPRQETQPKEPVTSPSGISAGDSSSGGSFSDPFPEESEEEADNNNPDMNPFTGINLNDDPEDPFGEPQQEKTPSVPELKKPDLKKIEEPELDEDEGADEPVDASSLNPFNPKLEDLKKLPENDAKEEKTEKNGSSVKKKDHGSKWKKISERFGLKGFKGFCPVALRDQRDLVDSKPEFRASFENRTYFLSSKKSKEAFEKNPKHYVPVRGGIDIVMLLDDEKQSHGSLDHALWYKDHLYLFSSSESLKTFLKNPGEYLKKLEQRSLEDTTKKE